MTLLLGCIADDFTGATDLASTLVKAGMRTVQLLGVPRRDLQVPDSDAIVIALKSRSNAPEEAVMMSLAALDWLRNNGAKQYYFKYCSTFDSTDKGNIGPVADAMLDALNAPYTVFNPAFPTNKRTVYKGHLFVGDELLSDSGMRNHPLNPMTDSNLVRVLGRQTRHKVGLVQYSTVERGPAAIRAEMHRLNGEGVRHIILDAVTDGQLMALGEACADLPLVTGASGMAMGLPDNFLRSGSLKAESTRTLPKVRGASAVLSGSCSIATQSQVAHMCEHHDAFQLDPLAIAQGRDVAADAVAWAKSRLGNKPVLIYSTAAPEQVGAVQSELGREHSGALVEETMGKIAKELVAAGVRRLVIQGG